SVGGGALIIILIILILVFLRKRQKRTQLKHSQERNAIWITHKRMVLILKKQHIHTVIGDDKKYVTGLTKAKCVNTITAHMEGTKTRGSNNVNVNFTTYSCVENQAIEALEIKYYNASKINTAQRQSQPSEFSNP
ncbi:unnamed protein product, partial [Lymnaea stagnalis]